MTTSPGTTACLGMLLSMDPDLMFRRVGLGFAARPVVAVINTVTGAINGRSARPRESGPGTLFTNFHVVAEVTR